MIPSWYRASKSDIHDTQGSFFREQALALAKRGYQLGVIHPQHRSMRQWQSVFTGRYGFAAEDDDGIPTLRIHTMTWLPRQIPYINYLMWVRNGIRLYEEYVERYGRPDVIHAHGMMYGGLLAWHIQRRHGVPFVITEHGTAYARNLFAPWELAVGAKAAAAADARLAVSEAFCQEMTGFLGGEWMPCPNVVSPVFSGYSLPDDSPDDSPDNPLRSRIKGESADTSFVFTTVAYLSKRKRIHHIITAFARAFKADSTTRLQIGGDGKERESLEALAAELGVADRVTFLGALDRQGVRDAIARSAVFILASQYETFGVVVIEALALGKPVIATRCGGPNQVMREQDGLMIPPDDVDALTAAMRHMRACASQYDVAEIRSACIARYGEAALVDRLSAVYANIADKRSDRQALAGHYA